MHSPECRWCRGSGLIHGIMPGTTWPCEECAPGPKSVQRGSRDWSLPYGSGVPFCAFCDNEPDALNPEDDTCDLCGCPFWDVGPVNVFGVGEENRGFCYGWGLYHWSDGEHGRYSSMWTDDLCEECGRIVWWSCDLDTWVHFGTVGCGLHRTDTLAKNGGASGMNPCPRRYR